jgi:predicted kinase
MSRLIIVCGLTGAGKTTYSIKLCDELNAIRFSIDPWMQTLFSKDMKSLDFSWMMERVERCQVQIWETSKQILVNGGIVVLDLGFTTKAQRDLFVDKSAQIGILCEIHYIKTALNVREERVKKRNLEKDPSVYAFEVTSEMFEFMEPRFEYPSDDELESGLVVTSLEDI